MLRGVLTLALTRALGTLGPVMLAACHSLNSPKPIRPKQREGTVDVRREAADSAQCGEPDARVVRTQESEQVWQHAALNNRLTKGAM